MERIDEVTSLSTTLNELLSLEHDAARAYAAVLERLPDGAYRATIERFVDDHARHADELTRLARGYAGGRPADARSELTGRFERAVRALPPTAGDRAILATLKSIERAGRDRYRGAARCANRPEVAAVLRRASNDEAAHYAWTLEALDDLAAACVAGRLERVLGALSSGVLGAAGAVDARAKAVVGGCTRGVRGEIGAHPLRAALVALGVGVAAAALSGDAVLAGDAAGAAQHTDLA